MKQPLNRVYDTILGIVSSPRSEDYRALGLLLSLCDKRYDESVPYGAVSYNKQRKSFVLHIGPKVEELNDAQLRFLLLHEAMHLSNTHLFRVGHRDAFLSNIAQDCIINDSLLERYPNDLQFIEGGCRMPSDYEGEWLFEELYEFLREEQDSMQQEGGSGSGGNEEDSKGSAAQGGSSSSNGESETAKDMLKRLQGTEGSTDTHMPMDDATAAEAAAVAERMKSQVAQAAGTGSGVWDMLSITAIKPGRWANRVKALLKHVLGSRDSIDTWGRPNRRNMRELPGVQRISREMAVLLDVSLSMSEDEIKRLLGQVLINGVTTHMYYVDTEIVGYEKIKDIRKASIPRGCGTQLGLHLKQIAKNHDVVIVLTDGYLDSDDVLVFPGKTVGIVMYTGAKPGVKKAKMVVHVE
jgi:predicted metal-dependent peptidase